MKIVTKDNLILTRIKKGWDQSELAKRVGLSRTSIHYIEHGKKSPKPHNAVKIAEALGVKFDSIFEITKEGA